MPEEQKTQSEPETLPESDFASVSEIEKPKGFLERLVAVQNELKAPKNQYNQFGKYKYRNAEDILEAVKPIAQVYQILIYLSDEVFMCGDRIYIKATATARDCNSTDCITASAYAREPAEKKGMDASQISGTASSYARKYALNGLLCIDDAKDPDTPQYQQTGQTQRTQTLQPPPAAAPLSGEPQQRVLCNRCRQPILPTVGKDGRTYQPMDVYRLCHGLCENCYKKEKVSC